MAGALWEQEKGGEALAEQAVVAEAGDGDAVPVASLEEAEKEKKEEEKEEKEEEGGGDLEDSLLISASATPLETASFKEESYVVSELREAERKALEAFRQKVEEAIKNKTILQREKKKKKEQEEKASSIAIAAAAREGAEVAAKGGEGGEAEGVVKEAEGVVKEAEAIKEEEEEEEEEEDGAAVEKKEKEKEKKKKKETKKEEAMAEGAAASSSSSAAAVSAETAIADLSPPPPPSLETEFFLWGGIPVHEQENEKTDVVLLKFLRARNFKVEEAIAMLKSTIRWRREMNADAIAEEELEEEGFAELAFSHGVDREGHPVCYNLNPFHNNKDLIEDKEKLSRFLRWRIQLMEKNARELLDFSHGGISSMTQVLDLQQHHNLLRNSTFHGFKKLLALLHDNYPDLASKKIVLNLPWYYVPALYRSFHDKVIWAGPGKSTETLFKHIAPEHVPARYGGLWRPHDEEFQGIEAPVKEVTVKGGEKHEIELPIAAGSQLLWDVSVVGWDVVYGEEFVPEIYTVIVRKPKKIVASEQVEPIRNSFKASSPGKLLITIDNSQSKKKKTVVYRSKSTVIAASDAS